MQNEEIDLSNLYELVEKSYNNIPGDWNYALHLAHPTHNLPSEYDKEFVEDQKKRLEKEKKELEETLINILLAPIPPKHHVYRIIPENPRFENLPEVDCSYEVIWNYPNKSLFELTTPKLTFWQKLKNLFN